jgi:GTPase
MDESPMSTVKEIEEVRIGIMGSVDSGKCFKEGTEILMGDYTTKAIEDIKQGEYVMGMDLNPFYVNACSSGKAKLFSIISYGEIIYVVNVNHILTLYDTLKGEIVDLPLGNFGFMDVTNRARYKGIRITYKDGKIVSKTYHSVDIRIRDTVESYYGLDINGNKRFLLSDGTVVHNSTLTGVLTKDVLDNGRGSARTLILKHPHEQQTGRTSCVAQHFIRENITPETEKVINFVDLAGHEKYLKTTISGITKCLVDYTGLIIGANMGVLRMTMEHLTVIMGLSIPAFIVITKVDIAPQNVLENTKRDIEKLMEKYKKRKRLVYVENIDHLQIILKDYKKTFKEIVPVFEISSVTGHNVDALKRYIHNIPSYREYDAQNPDVDFVVESRFSLTGIGMVVSGIVKVGKISRGDNLYLGPIDGEFKKIAIKSIHNNFKEDVPFLLAGNGGAFNIKFAPGVGKIKMSSIRKGSHILSSPKLFRRFIAQVLILHHPTTIRKKYQPYLHCGNISQSCEIYDMDKEYLRIGDRGLVKFRFMYKPEFINTGDRIIFREGKSKGVGLITEVFNDDDSTNK